MECRVCDHQEFTLILDLGIQPRGNHFLKLNEVGSEPTYPLRLVYCNNCSTAQLDHTIKKEVVNADHSYLSGTTKTLNDHFKKIALDVDERFNKNRNNKSVLDIGSNDGTQLKYYKELDYDVLGVEASKMVCDVANANHINTLCDYYNLECAKRIHRKFDVINAAGVFFHLEELHSVTQGIKYSLKEDGTFVIQCMYMKNIVDNCTFDQIYHEHLLFYTFKTLQILLNRHGLSLFDAHIDPIHGGSIMAYVTHTERNIEKSERLKNLEKQEVLAQANSLKYYLNLADKVSALKKKTLSYLDQKKKEGKTIYGFAAPVKGNTLLNYFGIGKNYLDCLVEKNSFRKETFSPGTHIPIVMEDELEKHPDVYFVLAWNFKDEILKRNQHLIDQGVEFYFPM